MDERSAVYTFAQNLQDMADAGGEKVAHNKWARIAQDHCNEMGYGPCNNDYYKYVGETLRSIGEKFAGEEDATAKEHQTRNGQAEAEVEVTPKGEPVSIPADVTNSDDELTRGSDQEQHPVAGGPVEKVRGQTPVDVPPVQD